MKGNRRFEFGKNWMRFLSVLNEERIEEAEKSLKKMLEIESLKEKTFLDIGTGSGLFSLAAKRLGASYVFSFDYDHSSVACCLELKKKFFPEDMRWRIEEGSVLDENYLKSLGQFDIVYAWGVLHHTGNMWKALENVQLLVAPKGKLFISIYNDQGLTSRIWSIIKRTYTKLPHWLKFLVLWPCFIRLWGPRMLFDLLRGKPFYTWKTYKKNRGMSPYYDVVDWVGGYPFEVARPDQIFDFYYKRGFVLTNLKTVGGKGCNEFVFQKN